MALATVGGDETRLPHCSECGRIALNLYWGTLCGTCHKHAVRAAESHEGWATLETLRGATPAGVDTSRMKQYCGNGHKWTPKTTRWRFRTRGSHGTGWERDCLICKEKSDGRHHMNRNITGRNVTVTITKSGTHWNSGRPGGVE